MDNEIVKGNNNLLQQNSRFVDGHFSCNCGCRFTGIKNGFSYSRLAAELGSICNSIRAC